MGKALVWETVTEVHCRAGQLCYFNWTIEVTIWSGVRHDFVLARCTVRPEDDPEGAGVCRDCHFDVGAGDWREHDDLQLDPLDAAEPCAGPREPGRNGGAFAGEVERTPVPLYLP